MSRHRSSVDLRWPSKRIAALHRLPIQLGMGKRCALRCAPMAARSLRHLIGDATLGRCRRWPLHGCPRYPARRLRGAIGAAGRQSGIGGELMVRYRLSAAAQTDLIDILGVVLARCMQPICAARASSTWAHTSQLGVLVRV
ncbi:hypothetical protein [Verminephrobacter eiseniae]|uniref:hypothetical protein n=1 Tax=Verminephrobacter eiseniae TaxID=364317 RepID=UPI0012ECBBE1|nr:hypothetical protein [Verminephrobacter eiseniae]